MTAAMGHASAQDGLALPMPVRPLALTHGFHTFAVLACLLFGGFCPFSHFVDLCHSLITLLFQFWVLSSHVLVQLAETTQFITEFERLIFF